MNLKTEVTLTLDLDWAIDQVIDDTLNLLESYQRPATLFCTNESDVLRSLSNNNMFELAIHPNFNPLLSNRSTKDYLAILKNLLDSFPDAIGMRSHSLVQSSPVLYSAKELGLLYDSNLYHPEQAKPYKDFSGLIRFTHGWTDLGHLIQGDEFSLKKLRIKKDHKNILCFHPIHIFLNTPTSDFYTESKIHYKNHTELKERKNTKTKGVRDIFIKLLKSEKFEFKTLCNHHQNYKKNRAEVSL